MQIQRQNANANANAKMVFINALENAFQNALNAAFISMKKGFYALNVKRDFSISEGKCKAN